MKSKVLSQLPNQSKKLEIKKIKSKIRSFVYKFASHTIKADRSIDSLSPK